MLPQHGTLEISRSRLRHNLALLRSQLHPHAQLCATIKANAYGHGINLLAPLLHQNQIQWAAVYSLPEALHLAQLPLPTPFNILNLAPLVITGHSPSALQHHLEACSTHHIRLNLTDLPSARALAAHLQSHKLPNPLHLHLQLDAGLTRIGLTPHEIHTLLDLHSSSPMLHLEGLFAHLSHGDSPNHPTLSHQLNALQSVAQTLRGKHPALLVHLQNSGGLFNIPPSSLFNLARVGIALYGLQPSTSDPLPNLQPIARVTAPILAIHDRPANTGVGYGHTFTTTQNSRIAIVPVGYADGYPRRLSNNSVAQIHNQTVPLIGRVSMDQIILDVTYLPSANIGDTVTVISNNPNDPNSLDKMADTLHTIGYELATHLGPRLARTIVD